jgi:prophage tail gpP-like protein
LVDIVPTAPIQVKIGSDKILTGYVDHYAASYSCDSHEVRISGRSMSEDLVDCSAEFTAFQINNTTLRGLANTLCQHFEIALMMPDGDSVVMPQFNVTLTETPYEILERVCRWSNFLLYDDVSGAIIIAKLGDKTMASGFAEGANVQEATVQFSASERYTEIDPVWTSTAVLQLTPSPSGLPQLPFIEGAGAVDNTFLPRASGTPRYRPLIVVSEQSQASPDLAKLRARWEMTRRWGRSQAVTVTCDSWRDSSGNLWAPNALAPIDLPSLKLPSRTWLISDVAFMRNERGTTAQVTLMPKEAFVPDYEVLIPFDWQVAQELPNGGAVNYEPAPR